MSRILSRYVTVDLEVPVDEVLDKLTDDELREHGLARVDVASQHHEALFAAVERGDCAGAAKAAEDIAWEQYGRILTGRAAA